MSDGGKTVYLEPPRGAGYAEACGRADPEHDRNLYVKLPMPPRYRARYGPLDREVDEARARIVAALRHQA